MQSTLVSLKTSVQPKVSTSYGSERYLREQTVNNAITSLKAANKATREAKEKEITEEYRDAENEAWNEYLFSSQTAYIAYTVAYQTAEGDYKNAKQNADNEYISTVVVAEKEYNDEYCRLTGRYYDAIGYADLGYGVDSTFYENGATSTDVQVCFVAGTPIVLANDVTKPIEEIEIGDIVYAKPHDNPTGELVKCRVTKVFHNAPQQTLKLTFDNGLVVQATKEHPFYVEGRGWVSAGKLEIGSECVSVNSTPTKLLSKELVDEKVPVYNFEVENAHTYFVGKSINESVLVHNECSDWWEEFIDNGWRENAKDVLINIRDFSVNIPKYAESLFESVVISRDVHWEERKKLNEKYDFDSLDLNEYPNPQDLEMLAHGEKVYKEFLGEKWGLYPPNLAIYHSRNGDSTDCFKWCSENGGELVIRRIFDSNGIETREIETDPRYLGTFNFFTNSAGHMYFDMLPYWVWGNSPNDNTPALKRIHPKLEEKKEMVVDTVKPVIENEIKQIRNNLITETSKSISKFLSNKIKELKLGLIKKYLY